MLVVLLTWLASRQVTSSCVLVTMRWQPQTSRCVGQWMGGWVDVRVCVCVLVVLRASRLGWAVK